MTMTDLRYRTWSGHPMTRGTKLAARIDALGYQLVDVTAATGIDRWCLNNYLNLRTKPSKASMRKLCAFLQCEPEHISE